MWSTLLYVWLLKRVYKASEKEGLLASSRLPILLLACLSKWNNYTPIEPISVKIYIRNSYQVSQHTSVLVTIGTKVRHFTSVPPCICHDV
jgi:hypothetical protein